MCSAAEQLAADDLVLLLRMLHILRLMHTEDINLQNEQIGVLALIIAMNMGTASHKGLDRGFLDGLADIHQRMLEEREKDVLCQVNAFVIRIIKE